MRRDSIKINGKSLESIEKDFSMPFMRESFKVSDDGSLYLPIGAYRERLKSVLGGHRWCNVITSPATFFQLGGRCVVSCTITIKILTDDNDVAWEQTASGGSNVILLKSGQAKSLKSDISSAASVAFKNCCKLFGIGAEAELYKWSPLFP